MDRRAKSWIYITCILFGAFCAVLDVQDHRRMEMYFDLFAIFWGLSGLLIEFGNPLKWFSRG